MMHERARDLLLELSYGELAPAEAREVEHHLTQCGECAEEWRRLGATRGALARLDDAPRDDGRRDAILDAARAALPATIPAAPPKDSGGRARRRARPRWAVAAMLAVATIVAGVTLKLADLRPAERAADLPSSKQSSGVAAAPQRERLPAVAAAPSPAAREEPSVALREDPSSARRDEPSAAGATPPRVAAGAPAAPRRSRAQPSDEAPRAPEDLRKSASREAASRVTAGAGAAQDHAVADGASVTGGDAAARSTEQRAEEQPAAAAAAPEAPEARDAPASSKSAASPRAPAAMRAPPAAEHRAATLSSAQDGGAAAAAAGVAARVEALAARGALTESSQELTCAGARLRRTSWAEAGVPLKLALASADGLAVEGWYDHEGRLRSLRVTRRGVEQPLARRLLDERGRVLLDEQDALAADPSGSRDADRAARWLPPRDPRGALGEGCAPVE